MQNVSHQLANADAEKTVLGALLLDSDRIVDVRPVLTARDFADPVLREVYTAIERLHDERTPIDCITVADSLKNNAKIDNLGGAAFLTQLAAEVPTSSHAVHYAKIIKELAIKRQLRDAGGSIAHRATDKSVTAVDALEYAEQSVFAISRLTADNDAVDVAEIAAERYEFYTQLHTADDKDSMLGIATGFVELDRLIAGLTPGNLVVVAGRPSMGKSMFAFDIARNIVSQQKKRVAFFSLEMTREELIDRIYAGMLGVDMWKLKKGRLDEETLLQLGPINDELKTWPLAIDDAVTTPLLPVLRSKARRLKLEDRLDLLVVDYLQLIELPDGRHNENRTQEVGQISRGLKQLAKELHVPIIAISQLSRKCEERPDKRPLMSDLRDSGTIEQDADMILMLYRDGYYHPDGDEPEITDLFVRKNRQGPTGQIELRFDTKHLRFKSLNRAHGGTPVAE